MENVGKIWKDLEISVIIELPSWKPLKETFRQLCVGVAIQDIGGIAKDSWLDKSLYCYKSSTVLIFALVDVYNMDFLQFCFHYIYIYGLEFLISNWKSWEVQTAHLQHPF